MISKLITRIRRLFSSRWLGNQSVADTVDCLDLLSKHVSGSKYQGGLCWEVGGWVVKRYAPSWKHFSGDSTYPVPHPILSAMDAFHTMSRYGNTEYGEKRRDLARHIRDCVIRDYGHMLEKKS